MLKKKSGVTFIELVVVIAIIMSLALIASVNLIRAQRKPPLTGAVDQLITDLKSQQVKAMIGDTSWSTGRDLYGVHFDANQYVLFRGSSYSPTGNLNFTVPLPDNFRFTNILLAGGNVIFEKGSGEISNFGSGDNAVTIFNTLNNETETLHFNRYGVIYNVN